MRAQLTWRRAGATPAFGRGKSYLSCAGQSTGFSPFVRLKLVGMMMRSERRNTHRVLMNFMAGRNGWRISFLEEDCRTSLPVKLTFATPDKIRVMQQRFGNPLLENRHALEHGLSIGRGGVWLTLNEEQYSKLKGRTPGGRP